jgi:hypothetical protein
LSCIILFGIFFIHFIWVSVEIEDFNLRRASLSEYQNLIFIFMTVIVFIEKLIVIEFNGSELELLNHFLVIIYFILLILDFFLVRWPYFSIKKSQFYLSILILSLLISVEFTLYKEYEFLTENEFFLILIVSFPLSIKMGIIFFEMEIQRILGEISIEKTKNNEYGLREIHKKT